MASKNWAKTVILILMPALFSCNPAKVITPQVQERNAQIGKQQRQLSPPVSQATPDSINYVYDNEGLYNNAEEKSLDSILRIFERSNLIAIKLETLSQNDFQGENFEARHLRQFKNWEQLHHNSGKTILVSMSIGSQEAKISYGSSAGKFINQEEINKIMAQFRPYFERGENFAGTREGLLALMDTIRKNVVFNPKKL